MKTAENNIEQVKTGEVTPQQRAKRERLIEYVDAVSTWATIIEKEVTNEDWAVVRRFLERWCELYVTEKDQMILMQGDKVHREQLQTLALMYTKAQAALQAYEESIKSSKLR